MLRARNQTSRLSTESKVGQTGSVSVVICTYDDKREKDLNEAVQSILAQTCKDLEIVIVVDGNESLFKTIERKYTEVPNVKVKVILNGSKQQGLAACMNHGIYHSDGDIICFLDDDAVASNEWISELLRAYGENVDAYGVGGSIVPLWLSEKPDFLPEEVSWLIGSTTSYFPQELVEVRNVWSSNVSYRKEVFKTVGVFSPVFGRKGKSLLQAEDADFGLRCSNTIGKGLVFNPRAVVFHKIYTERLKMKNLIMRSFKQGVAKALICNLHGGLGGLSTERSYLRSLLLNVIPKYLKQILHGSSRVKSVKQLLFIVTTVIIVSIGFLAGFFIKGNTKP